MTTSQDNADIFHSQAIDVQPFLNGSIKNKLESKDIFYVFHVLFQHPLWQRFPNWSVVTSQPGEEVVTLVLHGTSGIALLLSASLLPVVTQGLWDDVHSLRDAIPAHFQFSEQNQKEVLIVLGSHSEAQGDLQRGLWAPYTFQSAQSLVMQNFPF